MPNGKNETGKSLNWPPEKTCNYEVSAREEEIKQGDYLEINLVPDRAEEIEAEGRE